MGLRRAFEALITNLYFLFTPHNEEKTLTGMKIRPLAVHSRLAPPLVDKVSYSGHGGGVPGLMLELERNARHPCYVPFYDSLERCAVTSVAHMRSNKKQHELLIVEFTLTLPSGASDARVARIERMREQDLLAHRIPKSSVSSVEACLMFAKSARADLVSISDSLEDVLPPHGGYRAVQTLSALPAGTLDILDVLALAGALSETADRYSVLRYMCMWYAAAVFRLLRERAPAEAYGTGPAYAAAGTGRLVSLTPAIRLVDVKTAALVWPAGGPAVERRMEAAYQALYRRGLATPARREGFRVQLHDALAHDATLVRTHTPTLIDMRAAVGIVVPDIRSKLRQCQGRANPDTCPAEPTSQARAPAYVSSAPAGTCSLRH